MADVSSLADIIAQEMEAYSEEVDQEMQIVIDEVTKEAYLDLRSNPNIPKRSGEYAKGFYKKTLSKGRGYKKNRIGNKKYQLTHLLEKGHITRSGKRSRAFPHWQQAQEIVDKLPERLKRRLEK